MFSYLFDITSLLSTLSILNFFVVKILINGSWIKKINPFDSERPKKFNSSCIAMVSRCWSQLQALSVGGQHVKPESLALVGQCSLSLPVPIFLCLCPRRVPEALCFGVVCPLVHPRSRWYDLRKTARRILFIPAPVLIWFLMNLPKVKDHWTLAKKIIFLSHNFGYLCNEIWCDGLTWINKYVHKT